MDSPRSSYIEYGSAMDENGSDFKDENACPSSSSNLALELASVKSGAKVLEAKLNFEKVNFSKTFNDMQAHYRQRIADLENKIVGYEVSTLQVDKLEAERTRLENANTFMNKQIQNHEYLIRQSEIKFQMELKTREADSRKHISHTNQLLQAEKNSKKIMEEELSTLKINIKELKKVLEFKDSCREKNEQELQELRTKNKQLKNKLQEMEEESKINAKTAEEKYQLLQNKIDSFVTKANEKQKKEISKVKGEAMEKCQLEASKIKEEALIAAEKLQNELSRVEDELMQCRNQLAFANQSQQRSNEIYHNELTKKKEELRQMDTFAHKQSVQAQQSQQTIERLEKELSETRKEMTEEAEQHRKQLDLAREEFSGANVEQVNELERINKKADETIEKNMLDLLNAKQETLEARQEITVLTEKCKVANERLEEMKQRMAKYSNALDKLNKCHFQISETVDTKKQMENMLVEFKAKSLTVSKENKELKKKFQEMALELERAYADKDKQKSESNSKLVASIEQCIKATKLNSITATETMSAKSPSQKPKKSDIASRSTGSTSASGGNSQQKLPRLEQFEELKITNNVISGLLEKERLETATLRGDSKAKDAEIVRLRNFLNSSHPANSLAPQTPAANQRNISAAKNPNQSLPTAYPSGSFSPLPASNRIATKKVKRVASTPSEEVSKLAKIRKRNENEQPKGSCGEKVTEYDKKSPEGDNYCEIIGVICSNMKPLMSAKSNLDEATKSNSSLERKPNVEELNTQSNKRWFGSLINSNNATPKTSKPTSNRKQR